MHVLYNDLSDHAPAEEPPMSYRELSFITISSYSSADLSEVIPFLIIKKINNVVKTIFNSCNISLEVALVHFRSYLLYTVRKFHLDVFEANLYLYLLVYKSYSMINFS